MHFEDHHWMYIEDYLKTDDRLILVLGACEQHGYLSLLTDVKIPLALASAAAKHSGVLVAPPLNFGCSPDHLAYPGTISLRLRTYLDVVDDILSSLYGAGFRRILILNGHGGNTPVKTHLVEFLNEHPDLQLRWYAWWTSETVTALAKKYNLEAEHGNWLEAFDFTTVDKLPDGVKPIPDPGATILDKTAARRVYKEGAFGGAYHTEPANMDEMFAACLQDVLNLLKFD